MKLLKNHFVAIGLCALALPAAAQMPDDGFAMGKGELCTVVAYKQSSWNHYWEGTRYRDNLNLGTFTMKSVMPMLGYGITDKLNVFAGLPWITTSSDAGTMTGKKGWQDFSFAAKYQLFETEKKNLKYSLFGTGSFSLPASNYVPDYLPFSIGIGSKTAGLRLVNHLVFKEDFFATLQAGYTWRSNIKVDRITYYTETQHATNEMYIPNMWDASLRVGYDNYLIRADIHYMMMNTIGGTDMRRNDMPYPGNNMDMQAIGADVLFWVPGVKGLGIRVAGDQTITGRNMGQAFTWMAGAQSVNRPFAKKSKPTDKSAAPAEK